MKDKIPLSDRPPKDKRYSLSLTPEEMAAAREQSQKDFNGNFTRYVASLIERDRAGELWMGSVTGPHPKEKVIEALCRTWSRASLAKLERYLDDAEQPDILREMMTAFVEYLTVWDMTQSKYSGFDACNPGFGVPLVIFPKSDRDSIKKSITECSEVLKKMIVHDPHGDPCSERDREIDLLAKRLRATVSSLGTPWMMTPEEVEVHLESKMHQEEMIADFYMDLDVD